MSDRCLPLKGVGVLVTRAAHQATGLCRRIQDQGGNPVCFPALEIEDRGNLAGFQGAKDSIAQFDVVVFVSPNAVLHGAGIIAGDPASRPKIAAVGQTTARFLEDEGILVDIVPRDRFDSEALLETAEFRQVSGKRVLIVRGEGGRPFLGDSLAERGAEVVYLEVYRRVCPAADSGPLLRRWNRDVQIAIATSNDVLLNVHTMLGAEGRSKLLETPLLVVGPRMRDKAEELGHRQIVIAGSADDETLVDTLCGWARGRTASG